MNRCKTCTFADCQDCEAPFTFCHNDTSPEKEVLSDLFYFVGFLLVVAIICLIAGIAWGLFEIYAPSTACMVKSLFGACK